MPAPSFQDLYDVGKAQALVKNIALLFNTGDISDFMVTAAAAMADKNIQYAAELFKKTFLDGASEDDLTTLADDHFNITRNAANASTGTVTLTRPLPGSATPGNIAAGTILSTDPDSLGETIEFTTDVIASFGDFDVTLDVAVTASEVGKASNVDAAAIININDVIFDDTFQVTNALATAGGTEEESDESLRKRCRDLFSQLQRGTLTGLEIGALTVAGVAVASAFEDDEGLVFVYVADSSGNSSTQMITDVTTILESYRAAGSVVQVVAGTSLNQDVAVTVSVVSGAGTADLETLITEAITARFDALEVGEVLYDSSVVQSVMNVDSLAIKDVSLTTPASDVTPLNSQIIKIGSVTVTFVDLD